MILFWFLYKPGLQVHWYLIRTTLIPKTKSSKQNGGSWRSWASVSMWSIHTRWVKATLLTTKIAKFSYCSCCFFSQVLPYRKQFWQTILASQNRLDLEKLLFLGCMISDYRHVPSSLGMWEEPDPGPDGLVSSFIVLHWQPLQQQPVMSARGATRPGLKK